jgi:nitrate/TMAO reductase-like tetraheme cytochrome c subunit
LAVIGVFLFFSSLFAGTAAWYTSRSQFCRSCHIMEPYYVSWEKSGHADVACIKCHFPPGVGEKIRGKVGGLVQLLSYLSATEELIPAAHVSDASCLRSGCHERQLLTGPIDFSGVPFDHAPHFGDLGGGKELQCTSCHAQTTQAEHMSVSRETCFLCHFKDEPFNQGRAACTQCHQIPQEEFDLGGGVKFHHDLAYERGVSCATCHADLVRGDGAVDAAQCKSCHTREADLARIDDGHFLHEAHRTVSCLQCHSQIAHSLDPHAVATAASNCASCHPNQHQAQVDLLMGVGGRVAALQPSTMVGARVTCSACHVEQVVGDAGAVLMRASMETCATCHEVARIGELQQFGTEMQLAVLQLEASLPQVQEALQTAIIPAEQRAQLSSQLADLQHDLEFLRVGNGIHNIHYASTLTRTVAEKLAAIYQALNLPPPQVTLPVAPTDAL